MADELHWQSMASLELDREQPPHLRISSAGKCFRASAYAAAGEPESNPPGNQDRNRMAIGDMAEILILKELERNGWETAHTVLSEGGQLELKLELPGAGMTIPGHPDGICRHPDLTNNQWVTLECKSMGMDRALEVERDGIAAVYPEYIVQIGLYGRRMFEMKLVSHPERGVFGMMDRDGRMIPPERVSWERRLIDETIAKQAGAATSAKNGELPERPYAQSSSECKYCKYHSTCWGMDPEKEEGPGRKRTVTSEQQEVVEAARTWRELKPRVDKARDMLQAVSNSAGGADVMVEGIIGGYFQPRSERFYDPEALERVVPADILQKCLVNRREKLPAFWVRKANR